jgi:bifunctional non-homologous end joining protein LigD
MRRCVAAHTTSRTIRSGYAGFEGVIPAGQYGGGDVIVWDDGTWEPRETNDLAASLAAASCISTCTG